MHLSTNDRAARSDVPAGPAATAGLLLSRPRTYSGVGLRRRRRTRYGQRLHRWAAETSTSTSAPRMVPMRARTRLELAPPQDNQRSPQAGVFIARRGSDVQEKKRAARLLRHHRCHRGRLARRRCSLLRRLFDMVEPLLQPRPSPAPDREQRGGACQVVGGDCQVGEATSRSLRKVDSDQGCAIAHEVHGRPRHISAPACASGGPRPTCAEREAIFKLVSRRVRQADC